MPKILVVDDDDILRTTLDRALSRDDMVVTLAGSGKAALELLENEKFDLIITDVKMPVMDGITFLKTVKTNDPGVPVIVLTGFATIEMTREALQNGAYNFLTKPFEVDEMLSIVKKGLSLKTEIVRNKAVAKFAVSEFDFLIPNQEDLLNGVIFCILEQLKLMDFDPRIMSTEILMALDEGITNAFKHGNKKDPSKKIGVHTSVGNGKIEITIKDEGDGFDPDELINPLSPEGIERNCGRGVFLIRSYMDEVKYNRAGNELTMTKFNRG